jgi:hypothetical protein
VHPELPPQKAQKQQWEAQKRQHEELNPHKLRWAAEEVSKVFQVPAAATNLLCCAAVVLLAFN